MKMCAHTYIVKVLDCFTDKNKLCIVLSYANLGDLQQEIHKRRKAQHPFTETEILSYFTQICLALRCVHKANVIHRDIKGANIFLHNNGS